jgi:hypothetical protein
MVLRRSVRRCFYHQSSTPVIGQLPVAEDTFAARVGYLLTRNQIVKHDPHPLEQEFANMLEREHQVYARVEAESANHFMARHGQSLDVSGRTETKQIQENFFSLDAYNDALKATLRRYQVPKRVQAADLVDLTDPALVDAPPARHTLNRRLDEYLVLIVRDAGTNKWTVPSVERKPQESIRMTLDRAIALHHGVLFSSYTFSNAPQAVWRSAKDAQPLYVFSSMYLSGRPSFDRIEPKASDHAWVTRAELDEYEFADDELGDALRDIASSSTLDGSGAV